MNNSVKHAQTDYPLLDVLARRWSPYVFAPRPVEREKLLACLEAARWAPSSFNEQPWSFLVAPRENPEGFAKMLSCLVEGNQAWAKNAGVLMLTVVCRTFQRNNKPNRVAEHDIGLAAANLTVQATSLGLSVHQMAGVELSKARTAYQIPDTHDPFTGIALGYAGDPNSADNPQHAQRDQAPRPRKPLPQIVFSGQWGQAAEL